MKRRKLLRHLEAHGCTFDREGAGHTIYENVPKRLKSSVPRHREIDAGLVRKICKDLDVPLPRER
jgi:predicted RNA binding protein YcfA (HicA-like mRNA interferase family)